MTCNEFIKSYHEYTKGNNSIDNIVKTDNGGFKIEHSFYGKSGYNGTIMEMSSIVWVDKNVFQNTPSVYIELSVDINKPGDSVILNLDIYIEEKLVREDLDKKIKGLGFQQYVKYSNKRGYRKTSTDIKWIGHYVKLIENLSKSLLNYLITVNTVQGE